MPVTVDQARQNTTRASTPFHTGYERGGITERPLPPGYSGPGHFPTEQAAMKCLYLVTRSLDPTGTGRTRWTMRWKPVIDAFAITFSDRWPGAESY